MEIYERKNKGNPKRTPRSRSLCSPHLEERWISGNMDLDLLSLYHQRYERIMGGIERETSFPRSTMEGRERGENKLTKQEEWEWYLYHPPPPSPQRK
jgi:hypothetical protein